MNKFIVPKDLNEFKYTDRTVYYKHVNYPIYISIVKTISNTNSKWICKIANTYIEWDIITFDFGNNIEKRWFFNTKEERDEVYYQIINGEYK